MPTLIPTISTESEQYAKLPPSERSRYSKLGTVSCMSLITNKMIGTGLFSTPSIIFKYCGGHVALFLSVWLLGAVIILSGLLIYLEYALNLPFRNGGEKNYLLRVFRSPPGLVGCVYAFQMIFLGFSSGNSFAFGKYIWFAVNGAAAADDQWPSKLIGVACISFCVWLHIKYPNQGTALFNFLGMFKIVILFLIIGIGLLVAVGALSLPESSPQLQVLGSQSVEASNFSSYSVAVALLQVVYSFKGWENANYVLSELQDPYNALTFVAPVAVLLVTVLYFLVVVSYLIVIPKHELLSSGVLVAGIFFNKVFGESITSRVLPLLISLSTLGNVMVVSFAHSRVNQELAYDNYLPFSGFFRNLNHSLLLHWAVTVVVLLAPPSSEIYEFVVNLYIYPGTWINLLLTAGLIYLKVYHRKEHWGAIDACSSSDGTSESETTAEISSSLQSNTSSSAHGEDVSSSDENSIHSYTEFDSLLSIATQPSATVVPKIFSAPWICIAIFLIANVFLALFPYIPPPNISTLTGSIPYWCFPVVGTAVLLSGAVFFYARDYVYKYQGKDAPRYGDS